ncbi:MAG: cupin domain-containing protein [Rhodospirillaceae bacterium]|nr:cupin domain-containing protein [Rhodospirillaceae bacterium]
MAHTHHHHTTPHALMGHHPQGDALWAYAAGTLDEASSVLVATHLALCPSCRADVARMEAMGGEMLEDVGTAAMSASAFTDILSRIDEPVEAKPAAQPVRAAHNDTLLPRPLRDYVSGDAPWKKLTTGVEYIDLKVRAEGRRARLLKIAPGTRVPRHGHSGEEMTMVLAGGYSDEFGSYARGDVETADVSHVHQPVADAGEPCICLTVTRGALLPSALVSVLTKIFPRLGA